MTGPQTAPPLGRQIAAYRHRRGVTQVALAQSANLSLSLLRKVEQGARAATPAMISACARALHTTPAELQGQPYRGDTAARDQIHDAVGPLRAEVALYEVSPEEDRPPAPLSELRARTNAASRLAHDVRLVSLGAMLPDLLAELRAATYGYTGVEQRAVYALLAETWGNARMIAYRLGYPDLASSMAERYSWAATRSGDEYAAAVGDGLRAAELISVDRGHAARALLAATRHRTGEPTDTAPTGAWTAWGWSHLQAALAAARGTADTEAVTDHLAEAERAAEHVPATSDLYRMTLNRTNVAIWRAGLMVELGDGAAAIKAAATIHGWRGATPNRISHHHIDMARARVYVGQRDAALRDLITARRYAPTQVRYHPQVHETVRQLARLDRRRTDSLAELTAWLDHAHRQ